MDLLNLDEVINRLPFVIGEEQKAIVAAGVAIAAVLKQQLLDPILAEVREAEGLSITIGPITMPAFTIQLHRPK